MARTKNAPPPKDPSKTVQEKLAETSSLNKYFICDMCNGRLKTKMTLYKHIAYRYCNKAAPRKCGWCNIVFRNQGNLVAHTNLMHNNMSFVDGSKANLLPRKNGVQCVCDKSFKEKSQLRYHIRNCHFNLQASPPFCEKKKVNQVWYEKVIGTNIVMEIKKAAQNKLVMRKLSPKTSIQVHDEKRTIIDYTSLYPLRSVKNQIRVKCSHCDKMMLKKCIIKHIQEKHLKVKNHKCNNCQKSFSRLYMFMHHVCKLHKGRRKRINNRVENLNL